MTIKRNLEIFNAFDRVNESILLEGGNGGLKILP